MFTKKNLLGQVDESIQNSIVLPFLFWCDSKGRHTTSPYALTKRKSDRTLRFSSRPKTPSLTYSPNTTAKSKRRRR